MELFIVMAIPLLLALAAVFIKKNRVMGIVNTVGYAAVLADVLWMIAGRRYEKVFFTDFFQVDALSVYFMLVIAVISLASALYSIGYIERDLKENVISVKKAGAYNILYNLFTFTMLLVTVLNNMGIVWVSIEMTTLVSAFLVGFYNSKQSVEAAWKYLIICSVGITLALFGTILFYYTTSVHGGIKTLNWTDMLGVADTLDPKILKIAFLFIVIGYGTKAGLAPMHTWLPDAHSQALAPISALLSGVLLKTSIYAILRFMMVVNKGLDGAPFAGNLLLLFGLASLAVSAGFVIVQKDIKRLLAYSSIEHVGIIAVGLGIGGTVGVFGALLHVFNHAVTKSLMFFGAGDIVKHYRSHHIASIRGVIKTMPFTGAMVVMGLLALGGMPPFSIFISKLTVLVAGFSQGRYAVSATFLALIAVIFGGLIWHFSNMVFGREPESTAVYTTPLTTKIAFVYLFVLMLGFGVMLPEFFSNILYAAAGVLNGL